MKKTIVIILLFCCMMLNEKVSAQSCVLTCPQNIIVMADSSKEGAIVNFPLATITGQCDSITYTPARGSFFRLGSHTVTASTASGIKCQFTVTVTDNESPRLSPITLSRQTLWPASNKMKKVGVFYTATDNGQEVKSTISVTSNSPENKDWEIIDDHLLRLKASRLPNGEPRIYTITVTTVDAAGNKTKRTTSIAVSKTMVAKPDSSTGTY